MTDLFSRHLLMLRQTFATVLPWERHLAISVQLILSNCGGVIKITCFVAAASEPVLGLNAFSAIHFLCDVKRPSLFVFLHFWVDLGPHWVLVHVDQWVPLRLKWVFFLPSWASDGSIWFFLDNSAWKLAQKVIISQLLLLVDVFGWTDEHVGHRGASVPNWSRISHRKTIFGDIVRYYFIDFIWE